MTLEEFLARFTTGLADGSVWIVALLAGVTSSSVCPCTLPVGLGMAGAVGAAESRAPRAGLLIALAFAAGIVLNLTMLGALAGRIGAVLTESFGRLWALAMALMSVAAAGVAFLGPRLRTDKLERLRRPGVAGSPRTASCSASARPLPRSSSYSPWRRRRPGRRTDSFWPWRSGLGGRCRSCSPESSPEPSCGSRRSGRGGARSR